MTNNTHPRQPGRRVRSRTARLGSATFGAVFVLAAVAAPTGSAQAADRCGALAAAHRGGHDIVDENTVRSVHRAADLGANVELDLRVIQDDHSLAFMHDGDVRRTTDGRGQIEKKTRAQVEALRTEPNGGQVMFWRPFLRAMKANPRLVAMVEAKQFGEYWKGRTDVFERIEANLVATGLVDRVYLGGTAGFMFTMAREAPQVQTFWEISADAPFTVEEVERYSADMAYAFPNKHDRRQARRMKADDIAVWSRLSNEPRLWRIAVNRGATSVVTDKVQAFNRWCASRA